MAARRILSVFLIFILLVAVTGVSFSKHICLSGRSVACAKSMKCCMGKHSGAAKKTKCCTIQDFYFKANIVSTHSKTSQKFFPGNFVAVFLNQFFVLHSQTQYAEIGLIHKPPLLQSCRSILLDTSRLTI